MHRLQNKNQHQKSIALKKTSKRFTSDGRPKPFTDTFLHSSMLWQQALSKTG